MAGKYFYYYRYTHFAYRNIEMEPSIIESKNY